MLSLDSTKSLRELPASSLQTMYPSRLTRWPSGVKGGREFVWQLLDYEIRGALRYRRFLTVVLLGTTRERANFNALLDAFRSSDEWIRYERGHLAIIMRETDFDAAKIAIERAWDQGGAQPEFRFAVASYPSDGWNGRDLLRVAEERLAGVNNAPAIEESTGVDG